MAVVIDNLTKRYARDGDVTAIDGISLGIESGEAFGLLGPNGAGKTTTINVCTTRTPPTSGRVRIAGFDVRTEPILVRGAIGVVTQYNTLDRSCTVADNLYYHCRYFGMGRRQSKERTAELLEAFRLTAKAKAQPVSLSGGMVQRLQIARAVAHRPSVLFLDEPTAGLDPQSRLALWDHCDKLKADGTTILLTTHYLEEADRLCDRVAIIDRGKIIAVDSPEALIRANAGGVEDEPTLETVFINLTGRDLRE